MITFILTFFVIVIALGAAAVVGFSIYLKRKDKSLDTTNQKQFDEPPPYKSLFAPDDAEIRALEREARMKVEAERKEAEEKAAFEKSEKVREFEQVWRGEPTRQNTIELLRVAAESGTAEIFSQTAENVIQLTLHEQAGGLSKEDLADLLDSHLRILPQQERLSGAIFWLKQEIENLRRKSEAKS
jgi:hypothetical protein